MGQQSGIYPVCLRVMILEDITDLVGLPVYDAGENRIQATCGTHLLLQVSRIARSTLSVMNLSCQGMNRSPKMNENYEGCASHRARGASLQRMSGRPFTITSPRLSSLSSGPKVWGPLTVYITTCPSSQRADFLRYIRHIPLLVR